MHFQYGTGSFNDELSFLQELRREPPTELILPQLPGRSELFASVKLRGNRFRRKATKIRLLFASETDANQTLSDKKFLRIFKVLGYAKSPFHGSSKP